MSLQANSVPIEPAITARMVSALLGKMLLYF